MLLRASSPEPARFGRSVTADGARAALGLGRLALFGTPFDGSSEDAGASALWRSNTASSLAMRRTEPMAVFRRCHGRHAKWVVVQSGDEASIFLGVRHFAQLSATQSRGKCP